MDEETHNAEHDSITSPVPNCPYCVKEIYRRTHRCFGEGESTTPVGEE